MATVCDSLWLQLSSVGRIWTMTERSYGYKHSELGDKYQTAAEIAKLMRRDIKQAIGDSLLPDAAKYSVRVDNYAGGRSIDITVRQFPNAWQDCDGYRVGQPRIAGGGRELCPDFFCAAKLALLGETKPGAQPHRVLTADAEAAKMTLERIHGAYNHDGSDVMTDYFDVNYYGGVSFTKPEEDESSAADAAKQAAKRAATDAAAAAGEAKRVVVYGSKGKRTVHDGIDTNGRIRLVCGATLWRHSMIGDATGKPLTCSRCAKREAAALKLPVRAKISKHGIPARMACWVVTITRGTAELESHSAKTHGAALELAAEAIARLGAK